MEPFVEGEHMEFVWPTLASCVFVGILILWAWGLARRHERRSREHEAEFVERLAEAVRNDSVLSIDDVRDYYSGFFDQPRLTARDNQRLLQIIRKTSFRVASEPDRASEALRQRVQLLRDLRTDADGNGKGETHPSHTHREAPAETGAIPILGGQGLRVRREKAVEA
jgi:hypothetical protein